jgi:hypothetical protein
MGSLLTPEDKKLLSEAMERGPLSWGVIDLVKAAHGGQYPADFHAFVSKVQSEAFNVSIQTMPPGPGSAPASRSAAALKIDAMCEARLTDNGKRIASEHGVRSSDVSYNVFIVTVDSDDGARVDVRGMTGGGFSIGRDVGDVFAATRSVGGDAWAIAK